MRFRIGIHWDAVGNAAVALDFVALLQSELPDNGILLSEIARGLLLEEPHLRPFQSHQLVGHSVFEVVH